MTTIHQFSAQVAFNTTGSGSSGFPHDQFNLIASSNNWAGPQTYTISGASAQHPFAQATSSTDFAAVILRNIGSDVCQLGIANDSTTSSGTTLIDINPGGMVAFFNCTTPGTNPNGGGCDLSKWEFSCPSSTQLLVEWAST